MEILNYGLVIFFWISDYNLMLFFGLVIFLDRNMDGNVLVYPKVYLPISLV